MLFILTCKNIFRYLKTSHEDCSKKFQRATEILNSLGGEKERWEQSAEKMRDSLKTITGRLLKIFYYISKNTEGLSHIK